MLTASPSVPSYRPAAFAAWVLALLRGPVTHLRFLGIAKHLVWTSKSESWVERAKGEIILILGGVGKRGWTGRGCVEAGEERGVSKEERRGVSREERE